MYVKQSRLENFDHEFCKLLKQIPNPSWKVRFLKFEAEEN